MKILTCLFLGLLVSSISYSLNNNKNDITNSGNVQNDKFENCDQIIYSNNLSVSEYNSLDEDAYYSGTFYLAGSTIGPYKPDLSKTVSFNSCNKIVLGQGFKAVPTNTGKLILSVNHSGTTKSNKKSIDVLNEELELFKEKNNIEDDFGDINKYILGIYPNPNNGIFKIELGNYFEVNNIKVYNLIGEKVYEINNVSSDIISIDLSAYSKGLFFVKTKTKEGIYINKVLVK